MDRLEDYINNSMSDHTAADDGWNVPSEDVWNKASVHFPKKKKRRGFFWFFLGLGLSLLIGIFLFLYQSDEPASDVFATRDLASIIHKSDIESSTTIIDVEREQNDNIDNTINEGSDTVVEAMDTDVVDISDATRRIAPKAIVNPTLKPKNKINIRPTDELINSESSAPNIATRPQPDEPISINDFQDSPSAISKNVVSINPSDDPLSESANSQLPLLKPPKLPITRRGVVSSHPERTSIEINDMIPVKVSNRFLSPKQEISLGSTYFFVSALSGIDLGEEPRDDVFIDVLAASASVGYSRWIRPSISLSSGLDYVHLSGQLDFSDYEILEQDDIEGLTNVTYNELLKSSSLKARSSMISRNVSQLPFVQVGEEVRFHGNIGLALKAVQIPISVNKHWYKKRMEFFVGTGPTIEWIWVSQQPVNFNLEYEEINYELILDNPIESEQYIDYSIYAIGGMKFHFRKNYNLEMGLRINASEIIFSGFDLGLSYRWH